MGNVIDTVEDRIKLAILAVVTNMLVPRIEYQLGQRALQLDKMLPRFLAKYEFEKKP